MTRATGDPGLGLRVSGDGMVAWLVGLSATAPASDEAIRALLRKHKISCGINEARIAELVHARHNDALDALPLRDEDVASSDGLEYCIAKGEAARDGIDAVLTWHLDIAADDVGARVVLPGEVLATLLPASTGNPGVTVTGKRLHARNGQPAALQPGSGVLATPGAQHETYSARWLGVAEFDGHVLTLDPRLSVAADAMAATMDLFPRSASGQAVTAEHALGVLEAHDVVAGVDPDAIQQVLDSAAANPEAGAVTLAVAHGKLPTIGRDAQFTVLHRGSMVGQVLAHGRIDFHERDYPWNVRGGDSIGHLKEAQPGEDGYTVRGERIAAAPVQSVSLQLDGVHCDTHGKLAAEYDGALFVDGHHLSVAELLVIAGDVGAQTGNVDSRIPVHVKGHVIAGFQVKSRKDVIVEHNIEDATVRAGGSVLVKEGIRGHASEVFSPHDVQAGFIENANVFANGDICVRNSVINSTLSANGLIVVGGKNASRGSLMGGVAHANHRIEVVTLGASTYARTEVAVGMSSETRERLDELQAELAEREVELLSLLQLQERIRTHPPTDLAEVSTKLEATRANAETRQAELQKARETLLTSLGDIDAVRVVVYRQCHPGVIVHIHEHRHEVTNALGPGQFMLHEGAVVFVPL
ncbi:MAG: FapA family protein [Xanthomonadaceae bacterium]|nr:FapA family protein [Xanthomonadaceae bacterium]MDP2186094.1 FapA family protein [Xanthomonadales bacterium]MDZ4117489.1 FapA family protein [Xanthomonadaceae bacterium]MDZ4379439.1 FapA family protein [Xanthomonadaceae bacterium]